jgi:uncharacterized protein YukE
LRIYLGFTILLALLAIVAANGWLQVHSMTTLFDGFASSVEIVDNANDLQTVVADVQRTVGDFVREGSAEKKVEAAERTAALRIPLDDLRAEVEDSARQGLVDAIRQRAKVIDDSLLTLYGLVTLRQEVEDGLNYNDRDIRKGLTSLIGEGKSAFGAVFDRYLSARALTIRFSATGGDEARLRAELAKVCDLLAKLAPEVQGTELQDPYDDVTGGLKRYIEGLDRLTNALTKRQTMAQTIDQSSNEMRGFVKEIKQLAKALDRTRRQLCHSGSQSIGRLRPAAGVTAGSGQEPPKLVACHSDLRNCYWRSYGPGQGERAGPARCGPLRQLAFHVLRLEQRAGRRSDVGFPARPEPRRPIADAQAPGLTAGIGPGACGRPQGKNARR